VEEALKFLSVFVASAIAYGKLGMPMAIALFKLQFLKIMIVTISGGITGNIVFTNLSAAIIRGVHNYRRKRNLIHRKRIFTKFNRRIIRLRQRFGLAGIAFITPMFLSTPLGAFIAERFYRDKQRVILYLSVSVVLWALTLYALAFFFQDVFREWLL
jgi:hypothetical protein